MVAEKRYDWQIGIFSSNIFVASIDTSLSIRFGPFYSGENSSTIQINTLLIVDCSFNILTSTEREETVRGWCVSC